MPLSPTQLEEVLFGVTTPENKNIKACTKVLSNYLKSPKCVEGLLIQIGNSQKEEVRQAACIYLREKIPKHWPKLQQASRQQLEAVLLERLHSETSRPVRVSLASLVNSIAVLAVPDGEWPELLPFLELASKSDVSMHRESALKILRNLVTDLGLEMHPHFSFLMKLFGSSLSDEKSPENQLEGLRGCSSLLTLAQTESEHHLMQKLIPLVVNVITSSLQSGNSLGAEYAFEMFDNFVASEVPIMGPFDEMLMKFMLRLIPNKEVDFSIRGRAALFMRYMCEFESAKVLKYNLLEDLLKASILLQCESFDPEEFEGEASPETEGSQLLDSVVEFFDESISYEPAVKISSTFLNSQNEFERKASFSILYTLADQMSFVMKQHMDELLQRVVRGMKDPSSVVRLAATRTLCEFTYQLAPEINNYHALIIPVIFEILDRDGESTSINERACGALEVFCANMGADVLPYLVELMKKLTVMFAQDDPQLKQTAISAVASVAIAAKDAFLPFYQETITVLRNLVGLTDENILELRARAMSCVGSVAKGVGRKVFEPVFPEFLRLALAGLELEDPFLKENTYAFFQDLAEVFGEDFMKLPQMSHIMDSVSSSVVSKEGFTLGGDFDLDEVQQGLLFDEESDDDGSALDDIALAVDDGVRLRVNNAYIGEISSAIACIGVFTKFFGRSFSNVLPDCLLLLRQVEEHAHPLIRQSLLSAYDEVLKMIARCYPPENGEPQKETRDMIDDIFGYYIDRMENDDERVNVAFVLDYFSEAIQDFGPACLKGHMEQLSSALEILLNQKGLCQGNRSADDGVDGGVHSQVMDSALDFAASLAQLLGPDYAPFFQPHFVALCNYYNSSKNPKIRAAVIAFFCEIPRPMGATLTKYLERIISMVYECLKAEDHTLVQNAAYALGCYFLHCPAEVMKQTCEESCKRLHPLLVLPNDSISSLLRVRDNAVSCLCKMVLSCPQSLPLNQIVPVILSGLPLREDMAENKFVYDCVFKLWESQAELMSPNAARVLSIFADALVANGVDDETKVKIVQFTQVLFQTSGQQLQPSVSSLSPQQQETLKRCFQ